MESTAAFRSTAAAAGAKADRPATRPSGVMRAGPIQGDLHDIMLLVPNRRLHPPNTNHLGQHFIRNSILISNHSQRVLSVQRQLVSRSAQSPDCQRRSDSKPAGLAESSATAFFPAYDAQKSSWPSLTFAQGGLKQQRQLLGNERDKRNGRDEALSGTAGRANGPVSSR